MDTHKTTNPRAVLSLILGAAATALIPFLSLLFAPCGWPTALLAGIAAIVTGRRARREIAAAGSGGDGLARAGVVCGWTGIALNTLIMLFKLGLFILMFVLPALAVWQGSRTEEF